jgi:hypothetical protein
MPVRKDEPFLPERGVIGDGTHTQVVLAVQGIRVVGGR